VVLNLILQGSEGLMLSEQPRSVRKPVVKNLNKDMPEMERYCWEGQNIPM
jgi:hypothetical protein